MQYKLPPGQEKQSIDPKDYKHRVIVAGTRNWTNKKLFHETLVEYLTRFDEPILFISGAAPSGADRMIIHWCKKYKYPCLEMPADWDNLGRGAGFIRNTEMSTIGTHLLCFWDLVSNGTRHMRQEAIYRKLKVTVVAIKEEE